MSHNHRATVGIISLGEMGAGIARLLVAHEYRVLSNVTGRSEATRIRAEAADVELVNNDVQLVSECDYILSIVPPKDARAMAARIVAAYEHASQRTSSEPLYFLDLNAVAPSTIRSIADSFASSEKARKIVFIDGGIIGGPPKPPTSSPDTSEQSNTPWTVPSICLSGPSRLDAAPTNGAHLAETLNTRHVADTIGPASGLKCCFASLTKGATALAIQSYSTAAALGVLPDLESYIGAHAPARLKVTQGSLVGMPPKAGRWVEEMQEIGKTFREDGGWSVETGREDVFDMIAGVFEFVSQGTVLGQEHSDHRSRGTTVEDVVAALGDGLQNRQMDYGS